MSDPTRQDSLTVYLLEHVIPIRRRQLRMLRTLAGIQVIGMGADAATELQVLIAVRPDIILIGLRASQPGWLAQIQTVAKALPESILIVLAESGDSLLRKACLKAGGRYCFDRSLEINELRAALMEAVAVKNAKER
ncbi:response regulator transcription factor [Cupriavidus sp. L7L]|uniref:response regulator transcription factor n=1 Tax=Cupriavidus sp. L7L TaxID=2546443 RepID=UPI00105642D8|nr:response regulator transcription factor [Cupriavidus sp. L7L]TDF67221.1 response regulator transcription factor [Cupriavidus sp. L7L]